MNVDGPHCQAIKCGHEAVVRLPIARGADVAATDMYVMYDMTALDRAVQRHRIAAAELLGSGEPHAMVTRRYIGSGALRLMLLLLGGRGPYMTQLPLLSTCLVRPNLGGPLSVEAMCCHSGGLPSERYI